MIVFRNNLLQALLVCVTLTFVMGGTVAHAQEGGADESSPLMKLLFPEERDYNMPPLQPDLTMFLVTLVLFVGFVFVMRSAAWKPLIVGLNARESRVIDAEKAAEAARQEAAALRVETDRRLAQTQEQVKALIAAARAKAEAEKLEIITQAEQKAQQLKAEALAEIAAAKQSALDELSRSVDEQVAVATEHVVGRRLS